VIEVNSLQVPAASGLSTGAAPFRSSPGATRIGSGGWLPALGTRGFHRPLSDPLKRIFKYVATVKSVADETCE
jgi:hypothetical protein